MPDSLDAARFPGDDYPLLSHSDLLTLVVPQGEYLGSPSPAGDGAAHLFWGFLLIQVLFQEGVDAGLSGASLSAALRT